MNYRKKANITLIVVVALFVLTAVLRGYYRDVMVIKMLFFMAEAAIIGGMADWFAVTAIFKKPLGFPFHTAIIPKNRATIVNSIVNIVEKEFLSADIIEKRLERVNITEKIINWALGSQGREYILTKLIYILESNQGDKAKKISDIAGRILREKISEEDFDKLVSQIFSYGLNSGEYKRVINFLLDDIIKAAEGPEVKSKIYKAIDELKAEKTQGLFGALFNNALEGANLINIAELTDSIHIHLIETLYLLKNEEHETTKYIFGIIEEYLRLNAANPFGREDMKNIKDNLLGLLVNEELVSKLLQGLTEGLRELKTQNNLESNEERELYFKIFKEINTLIDSLKNNISIRESIEEFVKKSISQLINREHNLIGKIVRDTLDSFSDEDLNKFIEDRAGDDLQWIRMNGSIVGGMIGMLIFIFLNYFYDPIAVPFIRGLFS